MFYGPPPECMGRPFGPSPASIHTSPLAGAHGNHMKHISVFCALAALALALISGCASPRPAEVARFQEAPQADGKRGMALLKNYPSVKCVKDNTVYFIDGSSLPYDDGQAKDFNQTLQQSDIEDHFRQAYPALASIVPPALDSDPGRFRNDALLKKLYGESQVEIEANLVEVNWLPVNEGRKLLFNKKQNAAAQLQKVSDELDKLPSDYLKYVKNIDGTYQYRPIQGTSRLSPHSYGIAIDLDNQYTVYWLWDKEYRYVNEVPREIVEIFERHGFVWGGRWYHYDTMHFEYRPEMFERVL